ncbi:hypothetical protein [Xenorhabdus szentirmaii]|uniref:Lipoprotein n=1 Tax=Xenorhabdus szentirmaii TaxID=290112 RepID=A0AAW3YRH2_9GAMM|nr:MULTISPECIES: hypothetical protein [unclassified Xenorhabdus]MBD2780099.1 hypothetical protein [Xenorhabdus sp. 38]MBD2800662.1 hypothetical protein [Xenorhabdus sp. M]
MRKLLLIGVSFSALILFGCMVTPDEARSNKPIFESQSSKTVQDLAGCIYSGWTNTRVLLERDNTVHTESFNGVVTIFTWKDSIFADVKATPNGSEVKFYKTILGAVPVEHNRREIIERCLNSNIIN